MHTWSAKPFFDIDRICDHLTAVYSRTVSVTSESWSILLFFSGGLENSTILANYGNNSYVKTLKGFLDTTLRRSRGWVRCWHATQDGWDTRLSFHPQCDGKKATVTIVRVGQYVFGGFTDKSWHSGKTDCLLACMTVTDCGCDRLTDWLTEVWLTHWLTHWLTNWLSVWLINWLSGWLDWLVGWLAGRSVSWSIGRSVGWFAWLLEGGIYWFHLSNSRFIYQVIKILSLFPIQHQWISTHPNEPDKSKPMRLMLLTAMQLMDQHLGGSMLDLYISNLAKNNVNSRTTVNSYQPPPGCSVGKACAYFAGSNKFTPSDIEVFYFDESDTK